MRVAALVVLTACGFQPGGVAATGDDGGVDTGTSGSDATVPCTDHAVPPEVNVPTKTSYANAPTWNCNAAGTTTIDTTAATVTSTNCLLGALDLTASIAQTSGGPDVMVVRLQGLAITNGHSLVVTGNKALVLLVAGDVLVDSGGMIDASASGATPGPGGSPASCADQASGLGGSASNTGWGAGGGGFGTAGGQGCYNVINGGFATGEQHLTPLAGGCPGATSRGAGEGGAGGGAIEISATGTIKIGMTGIANIAASGGGGRDADGGGNGGGAGGGILLVAPTRPTIGAMGALRAHGGSGTGGKASTGSATDDGGDGHKTDNTAAVDASNSGGGGNGNDHGRAGGLAYVVGSNPLYASPGSPTDAQNGGRGGGGGGGGRIVVTAVPTATSCD